MLFHESTVEIGVNDQITHEEVAPLLDALNERFMVVRSTRINFQPPAAGGPEVALVLSVTAGVISTALLSSFFAEMGKDAYKAIRDEIGRFLVKRRRDRGGGWTEPVEPFALVAGRLRFYFDSDISDEELVERFNAARTFVESLLDDDFSGSMGPGDYGLNWNPNDKCWQGQVFPRLPQEVLPGFRADDV
ncbi:MAG: hypothetical protein ACRDJH_15390 [Thermomicrobiales bacterium]